MRFNKFVLFLTTIFCLCLLSLSLKPVQAQNRHNNSYGLGLDLHWYCSDRYGSSAKLSLRQQNAYGFKCTVGDRDINIDMNDVCISMYGSKYRSKMGDESNISSWYCDDSKPKNKYIKQIPLLQSPVKKTPYTGNPFDHGEGTWPNDSDNTMILYTGQKIHDARRKGHADGHKGYDWGMPWGTELFATAEGEVQSSGLSEPYYCALTGNYVRDNGVYINHSTANGEKFQSVYSHVSKVFVKPGDRVQAGQLVALSGGEPIGCSSGQVLHFSIRRLTNTNNGKATDIDPYGWQGNYPDPWANSKNGAPSVWLWKPGEAPKLLNRHW